MPRKRRICFVTGTRAEFGLMERTLRAIQSQANLQLQIIATGMHLDRRHGKTLDCLRRDGWNVDAVVKWPAGDGTAAFTASAMGLATASLAKQFKKLRSDVVLVVGDRVEALAAASAAQVSGLVVAHVHGGDRALGQVDDSLRHAITKLAHVHFPATAASARRIARLGENRWRIHRVGSPGIDGIVALAASRGEIKGSFPFLRPGKFALIVLHPTTADVREERRRARTVIDGIASSAQIERAVIIYPNNDPGSAGIIAAWEEAAGDRIVLRKDVGRAMFLGLLRESVSLIGNSSSGIIEAASFGTPVLDLGDRQLGRERNPNVWSGPFDARQIARALQKMPRRYPRRNLYGARRTGERMAQILANLVVDDRLLRKLISY